MAKTTYPIVIHPEKDCFWISFPDLPGCYGCCNSLKDVDQCSEEALMNYCIAEEQVFQRKLPRASTIEKIRKNYPEDTVRMISVDLSLRLKQIRGEEVRKTIVLPKWLAETAEKKHIDLNQLINQALLKSIMENDD